MTGIDTSNLERIETPRDRVRRWWEDLLAFLGVATIGWFIGDSVLALVSKGGWVSGAVVVVLAVGAFLWFWWSAWSRRAKLVLGLMLLLAIAVPLANHYA